MAASLSGANPTQATPAAAASRATALRASAIEPRAGVLWVAWLAGLLWPLALAVPGVAAAEPAADASARALLKQRCVSCHGAEKQEGGLRLDIARRALLGGDSGKAIVPGKPAESPLLARVASRDEDERMPPEGEGTPLTAAEVGLLRSWIELGARWPQGDSQPAAAHWSFRPLSRSTPPAPVTLSRPDWVRNPIDAYVLRKLDQHHVAPAAAADRATLIRRVHLDLLGLPPAPEELARFLADESPTAYQDMVDRTLESPHYGERWARHWLDLARYADSDGYEKDRPRPNAWRYRQWVIEALNNDMPFDRFTVEQIAGDMLPDADVTQRVATGFHRNTLHNTEGGADPEEDRVKKTVDRINTIGSIWLGMTVGCAQCHSHKYDPITQREYYQLYALVNNIDEKDVAAPTDEERVRYAAALSKHQQQAAALAESRSRHLAEKLPAAQRAWEQRSKQQGEWSSIDPTAARSQHGAMLAPQDDGSLLATGDNKISDAYTIEFEAAAPVAALRLEVLPDKRLPKSGPGRAENGNFVLTTFKVARQEKGKLQTAAIASASADFSQSQWDVALAANDIAKDGWAVSPQIGQRHVARFTLQQPIPQGSRVVVTLDQHYEGAGAHNLGRFRLTVSSDGAAPLDGLPEDVAAALARDATQRSKQQQQRIDAFYLAIDPQLAAIDKQIADHRGKAPKLSAKMARAVVQRGSPRQTRIHLRGDFLNPGDPVEPAGLEVLPPIVPSGDAPNRLDLARWLVSPDHPLTARVTVNRIWQRYFGGGIVQTVDDFGSQGAAPSHPDMLDWLAAQLRDGGWRLKDVHRLILGSATYRQSSQHRPELQQLDPDNELLPRHPRRRVEAEIVRDLALAVSGLLSPQVGGPSVRPPQPAEYSKLTYANSAKWAVSAGGDRYRRGLYTFFQRTSPYPMLMTFDSPDSNECTARRSESNTPLQALTLWNDAVFFECGQQLGRRIVAASPAASDPLQTTRQRIDYALRLCLSRTADEDEMKTLVQLHQRHAALCRAASDQQRQLLLGKAPLPAGVPAEEAAAWVLTGRVLLNLDEFITKQ